MPYNVAYEASLQVASLSSAEKAELESLFSSRSPATLPVTSLPKHFISRLGDKRVLWRRGTAGEPEIVAIVDRSYAAA